MHKRCSRFRQASSEVPGKSCPGPKQNLSFAKCGVCGRRAGPGDGDGDRDGGHHVPRERGAAARGRTGLLSLAAAARPGQRARAHPPSGASTAPVGQRLWTAARVLNHGTPTSANLGGRGRRPALASPETTHLHGRRIQTAPEFAPGLALHTGRAPSARCSFCSFFNAKRFFSSLFSFFFLLFFSSQGEWYRE